MDNINIIDESHPAYIEFEKALVQTVRNFNPFQVGSLIKLNILFFLPQAEEESIGVDFPLSQVQVLNDSTGLVGIVIASEENGNTLLLMENGKVIPINYKNVLALEVKFVSIFNNWNYTYKNIETLDHDFKNGAFNSVWEAIRSYNFERQNGADALISKLLK